MAPKKEDRLRAALAVLEGGGDPFAGLSESELAKLKQELVDILGDYLHYNT